MSESLKINNIKIKQENCLNETFFNQPCIELANTLLGKYLIRRLSSGELLVGKIVETESYCGVEDRASHSYNNKRTQRNEPMFMKCGTIYVYFTYGMYHCFNISSKETGSAVLIRSLEPVHGFDTMLNLRNQFNTHRMKNKAKVTDCPKQESGSSSKSSQPTVSKESSSREHTRFGLKRRSCESPNHVETISINKKSRLKHKDLCNGPSKLCISMDITIESMNKYHISENEQLWVQDLDEPNHTVVRSSRIGIGDSAKEWRNKLLRFYILGNENVSKVDKLMESKLRDLHR